MALKKMYATAAEIPEGVRDHYVLRDGRHVLDVEGGDAETKLKADLAEANGKVSEFRETNIGLRQKLEASETALAKVKDIDPVKYAEAMKKLEDLPKMKNADEITKLIEAAVKPLTERIDKLTQTDADKSRQLLEKDFEATVTREAIQAGVDENALPDLLSRSKRTYVLDGEKYVAKNGTTPLFSKAKPSEPLSIKEWLAELPANGGAHLFKPSKGGGALPSPGGSGDAGVRTIPAGASLTTQDLKDIAAGKAVREEAVA